MYWPGCAGGSGEPSSAASSNDRTSALSSREATTTTGRKPRHARGADAPRPETGVARCAACFGGGEQRLHRALPVQAECGNSHRAAQGFDRVLRRIQESIDLSDRHALRPVRKLFDAVAGADLPFLDDAEIKAGPVVRDQQRGHIGAVQSDADPVAGIAWLAHLDDGAADPETIADVDLVIGEALHCEVLAEISGHEIRPPKISAQVPGRN